MRSQSKRYFIIYTAFFCVTCFGAIIIWHLLMGKSLIADYDSLDQHYTGFLYVGKWIREFFHALFSYGHIDFKMWEPAIGYGGDAFATMAAYFGDPFCWLGAFIPARYSEIAYETIIILKIYLCGLTFSIFGLKKGHSENSVLVGALVYAFAASVYVGLLQTIFLSVMYLFPMVMLGTDMLWEERKRGLFVLSLFLTLMTYFYFAYMVAILVFGYCIIRLFTDDSFPKTARNVLSKISDFVTSSILALGASCVFILPAVIQLKSAGRLATEYYIPFFYDKERYIGYAARFFDVQWTGPDSYVGISAIVAPCLIALFMKKGNRTLKAPLIVLSFGLLFPYFGWMMNGFGYVTNRWSFAYSFCLSYVAVVMIPELRTFLGKTRLVPVLIGVSYFLAVVVILSQKSPEIVVTMLMVLAACIFAAFSSFLSEKAYWNVALIFTVISLCLTGMFILRLKYGGWMGHELDCGEAFPLVENSSALSILSDEQKSQPVRFDKDNVEYVRNAGWYQGMSGMDFYVSLYNNNVDVFHNNMALLTEPWAYGYEGLNKRSELESLFGVKYYMVKASERNRLPYGYDNKVAEGNIDGITYEAYSPSRDTSLMYLFDESISEDYYKTLTPMQKQQALMQAIVKKDTATDFGKNGELSFEEQSLPYELVDSQGAYVSDGVIYVEYPMAYITLEIHECTDEELYAFFYNLRYENGAASDYAIGIEGMRGDTKVEGLYVQMEGLNNKSHMYGGKNDWLLNLGHSDETTDRIRIIFGNAGSYYYDFFLVYTRSKESIIQSIESLVPTGEDIEVSANKITATVEAESDSSLLLTVPYSTGWTAYIDGEKIETFMADDAFIGIPVSAGSHTVILKYITPGLLPGLLISLLSVAVIITMQVANAKSSQKDAIISE